MDMIRRFHTKSGIAYAEQGAGEPLVLIHGVGMRLEAWAPQMAALGRSHRVIAVDMPGHGESRALPENAGLDAFVAWLGLFLDDLELDRANLAGHSMGALIAGGAAATFGSRVSRVALLNAVYRRDAAASAAVIDRAREIRAGQVDVDGPLLRWFGADSRESSAYRLTHRWLSSVDRGGYATAYAAFAAGDSAYADCWPDVGCPALFLTGTDDPNSTPAMAQAMAYAAPNGYAVLIDGHRHMVNLTAPDEVNAILSEWLEKPEEKR
ncbi:alpha/beta fold hydrolase [Rhizobium herbae]|uniref:Pimeloyl-ACP methyl ester carboxylesterase n=1 Tax=Rhizobium herbae TaxID=508661 RepID=A0ABS4EU10_9HYPH|nr:alpha/beta hydrolase [Rhizobium herbae]MBP1861439.1 pimeloyl-ACP methyl ester carboxylesterase [Rhizobium herbae]